CAEYRRRLPIFARMPVNMPAAPDFSLHGKLALITGATQGLGRIIAQAYAASGARVIINGRHSGRVSEVVSDLTAQGYTAYPFVQDVGHLDQLASGLDELRRRTGTPDILVNNVGIRIRKSLADASLLDIQELI